MADSKRKRGDTCPLCSSNIEEYIINFDTAIKMCESFTCDYPFNKEAKGEFFVKIDPIIIPGLEDVVMGESLENAADSLIKSTVPPTELKNTAKKQKTSNTTDLPSSIANSRSKASRRTSSTNVNSVSNSSVNDVNPSTETANNTAGSIPVKNVVATTTSVSKTTNITTAGSIPAKNVVVTATSVASTTNATNTVIADLVPIKSIATNDTNVSKVTSADSADSVGSTTNTASTANPTSTTATNFTPSTNIATSTTATNFTPSTANPTSITATNFTPSTTNPTSITATNFTPSTTNPTSITATNFTPSTNIATSTITTANAIDNTVGPLPTQSNAGNATDLVDIINNTAGFVPINFTASTSNLINNTGSVVSSALSSDNTGLPSNLVLPPKPKLITQVAPNISSAASVSSPAPATPASTDIYDILYSSPLSATSPVLSTSPLISHEDLVNTLLKEPSSSNVGDITWMEEYNYLFNN